MPTSPDLDIVITGATGFTGQLIAEYLSSRDVKLCIAGRSKDKLQQLSQRLSGDVEIAIISLDDHDGLVKLLSRTRVVIAAAGPYAKLGEPIIRAAVEAGVVYIDLTGEPQFVKAMIAKYGAQADRRGALIVNSCGCDSVPYDLSLFLAAKELEAKGVRRSIGRVRTAMRTTSGAVSGGTFLSLLGLLEECSFRELLAISFDRELLSPLKNISWRYLAPRFLFYENGWGGIWAASLTNRAHVYRTQSILEQAWRKDNKSLSYGPKLDYEDFIRTPDPFSAFLLSSAMLVAVIFSLLPGGAILLRLIGPKSGSGPSKATRDKAVTTWTTFAYAANLQARVELKVKGDAGYKGTAALISECALYALHAKSLPTGFLTPALAFGSDFAKQLSQAEDFELKTTVTKM